MTITFPRPMPTAGVARQRLEIARVDYGTPETGGRMTGVQAGFPLWKMELELGEMGRAEADAWRAFVASLRGSLRTFYAKDLVRPYPYAHPGGLAGFSGAATSWSVSGSRDVLTLNLPAGAAGLSLSLGDLVGFSWSSNRRTAARVVEAGAYTGGSLVCSIEPPLPSLVPGGAVASVYGAEVVMRLMPGENEVAAEDQVSTSGGRISALQDLRA